MPYKHRDVLHTRLREFRAQMPSCTPETWQHYSVYVAEAWEIIGPGKDPATVTRAEIAQITLGLRGNANTRGNKLRIIRMFLRFCGNKEALKWRISLTPTPKVGGVFLNEEQVVIGRSAASSLGPLEGLMYSLACDMGLRSVDMCRLTVRNADEFLTSGGSMILGKGKNGGKLAWQKFNRSCREPLLRWLETRSKLVGTSREHPALLVMSKCGRLRSCSRHDTDIVFLRISALTGLKMTPHDGRRTFGHRLHRAGVDLETIATLMRHDNVNTTFKSYIGITQDELADAMDLLVPKTTSQARKPLM